MSEIMIFPLLFLLGHDDAVNSVEWSHEKKWLVSASEDSMGLVNKVLALILVIRNFCLFGS